MRKIIHQFFLLVFVAVFILILGGFAMACSCAVLPIEDEISSKNIVILELKSTEKYKDGETGFSNDNIKQSKLIVRKVFKGQLKIGQELNFAQGGGADCIWTFSEKSIGTKFLFFLNENNFLEGLWNGPVCSRSGQVKFKTLDLLYLEKDKEAIGKNRLSGVLNKVTESMVEGEKWNYKPLGGMRVNIRGNGLNITLKTDKNGAYEIYNLPVGKYKIIPQKMKNYRVLAPYNDSFEINIKSKRLIEQNFEYFVN